MKRFFVLALFCCAAAPAVAQTTPALQVIYPKFTDEAFEKLPQFQQDLLDLEEIRHFEVRMISSQWAKSKWVWHEVRDGKLVKSEEMPAPTWQVILSRTESDTLDFTCYAKPVAEDSIRVFIRYRKSGVTSTRGFHLNDATQWSPIWMETYLDPAEPLPAQIPVIAFSRGIKTARMYNGQEYFGVDFCGLRDQRVHPKYWAERFDIPNYIYITIEFEE